MDSKKCLLYNKEFMKKSSMRCFFSKQSLKFYSESSNKIIFLRDPFDRALSFYLEKVVELKLPALKTFFSEL